MPLPCASPGDDAEQLAGEGACTYARFRCAECIHSSFQMCRVRWQVAGERGVQILLLSQARRVWKCGNVSSMLSVKGLMMIHAKHPMNRRLSISPLPAGTLKVMH